MLRQQFTSWTNIIEKLRVRHQPIRTESLLPTLSSLNTTPRSGVIDEELQRLGWSRSGLLLRRKGDPKKRATGNRLRRETVLSVAAIAAKLHLGNPKSGRQCGFALV